MKICIVLRRMLLVHRAKLFSWATALIALGVYGVCLGEAMACGVLPASGVVVRVIIYIFVGNHMFGCVLYEKEFVDLTKQMLWALSATRDETARIGGDAALTVRASLQVQN